MRPAQPSRLCGPCAQDAGASLCAQRQEMRSLLNRRRCRIPQGVCLSPHGVGFITEEHFAAYPGNADVLVGWDTDDGGRSRKCADEDVSVPRIAIDALLFRITIERPHP